MIGDVLNYVNRVFVENLQIFLLVTFVAMLIVVAFGLYLRRQS